MATSPGQNLGCDTRLFDTGATRDSDEDKLDYEGFLSPIVLERFAQYMHEKRASNVPPGQTLRESDNWQKGIPRAAYIKSLARHFMEVWLAYRYGGDKPGGSKSLEEALCAMMFNVQGMLFEALNGR